MRTISLFGGALLSAGVAAQQFDLLDEVSGYVSFASIAVDVTDDSASAAAPGPSDLNISAAAVGTDGSEFAAAFSESDTKMLATSQWNGVGSAYVRVTASRGFTLDEDAELLVTWDVSGLADPDARTEIFLLEFPGFGFPIFIETITGGPTSGTLTFNAQAGNEYSYMIRLAGTAASTTEQFSSIEIVDPCPADVNNDGVLSGADFNAWLVAFNAMDPAADQNNDGVLNGADFNAWLANFQAGCD